ncbi:MAG: hypothetical protein RLZZ230_480 [Candidatus Parcubacteria bacterium]|jgi:hypothetical protein
MSPELNKERKLDHELLPYLNKMIYEEYHYFSPSDRSTQKHNFLHTSSIDFTYSNLKQISLEIYQEELDKMRQRTDRSAVPETAKLLYQNKLSEQQKIVDILKATKAGDDEGFHHASCDLYGSPQPELYWFTVLQINNRFSSLIKKTDARRKTLHAAFSVWQEYFSQLEKPARPTIHRVPIYPGLYISDDTEIDSSEKIHKKFSKYLEKNNIYNWTVKIDFPGARTAFGVDQTTKVISIPHDSDLVLRKDVITKIYLEALLQHEIGVHVTRRENGDNSQLALLGIGLDNYLRAEEGIATLAEQLIMGANTYSGELGYFAIGAGMGLLSSPLDFNSLFTLLNAYFILNIADEQLDEHGFYELDELRLMASDKAWERALRTYRGTTGNTPGAVYTRDIIYLEGNIKMWKLLDTETNIPPHWLIGKYDPSNATHVDALSELGIL